MSMENQFKPLDLVTVPLEGVNLIEASAGTGKTFTIANLFLRLVLETDMAVGSILVVTFTEAATKELKERIRTNLASALGYLSDPALCDDGVIAAILDNHLARGSEPEKMETRLKRAVLSFDEASIFTIHGFCRRVLSDNAFESGIPFDMELIKDQTGIVADICDDFWRKNIIPCDLIFSSVLKHHGLDLKGLYRFSGTIAAYPLLTIIPETGSDAGQGLADSFQALKEEWQGSRSDIIQLLKNADGLSRSAKAYREDVLDLYIEDLDDLFSGTPGEKGLKSAVMVSSAALKKNVKKNKIPPDHRFFTLCDRFLESQQVYVMETKTTFARFFREELAARKRDQNLLFFDDLLLCLNNALQSTDGETLAGTVAETYRAALIDEFQDTDPVQYQIFSTLFRKREIPFFMIGDPKQSIYGFRGADIFAYIQAAGDVDPSKRYTLATNFRSQTGLVEAVNQLFLFSENPFVLGDAIAFNRVTASPHSRGNKNRLVVQDEQEGSLVISWLEKETPTARSKHPGKEEALKDSVDGTVYEISRLLFLAGQGRALLGEKPVSPSDIAVLVMRNSDAALFKEKLAGVNIPAVVTRADTVFHTREAQELLLFLSAVAVPRSAERLNAALVLPMIGCSGNDLFDLLYKEEQLARYEAHVEEFARLRETWEKNGFMPMFRRFLSEYGVRQNLLNCDEGERRLTNLLHLSELIHGGEQESGRGISGVLSFLTEQIASHAFDEEQELRLEHDNEAVQICTVFKSKGLQYPVVFCPVMWQRTADLRSEDPVFHHREGLFCDIGSDSREDHRKKAARENLSELLRLLYVAVTRAENRCCLSFGKIGSSGAGPLEYLFTNGGPDTGEIVPLLKERIKKIDPRQLLEKTAAFADQANRANQKKQATNRSACSDLTGREGTAPGDLDRVPGEPGRLVSLVTEKPGDPLVYQPHGETGREECRVRPFDGTIAKSRTIASFSMLAAGKNGHSSFWETPGARKDDALSRETSFDFPGGRVTGLCIHNIFEHLDFSLEDLSGNQELIRSSLARYGLDREENAGARIEGMVVDVMNAPLGVSDPGVPLTTIQADKRIAELEFYFPVAELTTERLKDAFAKYEKNAVYGGTGFVEKIGRLTFKAMQGFMVGYMDLVFCHEGRYYLADWKTNDLGPDLDSYRFENLEQNMVDSLYVLQYHIYCVALHKYLAQRIKGYDYTAHFGGVFYLYIRGMTPERPGNGVFFDCPDEELIMELCGLFG